MVKQASCFNNVTGMVHIPFKDNTTLNNDLFQKCVPTLEYQMRNGNFKLAAKNVNIDLELKRGLKIRIATFKRFAEKRIPKEESIILTKDFLFPCPIYNNQTHILESGDKSGLLFIVASIVGIILLIIIVISVAFVLKKRIRNQHDTGIGEDVNPDYGYDYGEAEIKDVNDYYFMEEEEEETTNETL